MRIIGGAHKGRILHPPKNLPVRPTTDRSKESLFNILDNYIEFNDICALDLFAGTGNIALELASRGVHAVTAVDAANTCCRFIKETAKTLNLLNLQVSYGDAFSYITKSLPQQYDLVFADPPYQHNQLKALPFMVIEANKLLKPQGIFVLEHPVAISFKHLPYLTDVRTYGQSVFSFFKPL